MDPGAAQVVCFAVGGLRSKHSISDSAEKASTEDLVSEALAQYLEYLETCLFVTA